VEGARGGCRANPTAARSWARDQALMR
jgi:hypothetical protein